MEDRGGGWRSRTEDKKTVHHASGDSCENCWVKQGTQHEAAIVARRIVCRINASHSRKWVGKAFNPANSCAG